MTTPKPIADQLREAIKASGLSMYEIAKKSDVGQPTISRFMSDPGKTLNIQTVEALARALGLMLEIRKAR